jgi:hypothetical protein
MLVGSHLNETPGLSVSFQQNSLTATRPLKKPKVPTRSFDEGKLGGVVRGDGRRLWTIAGHLSCVNRRLSVVNEARLLDSGGTIRIGARSVKVQPSSDAIILKNGVSAAALFIGGNEQVLSHIREMIE